MPRPADRSFSAFRNFLISPKGMPLPEWFYFLLSPWWTFVVVEFHQHVPKGLLLDHRHDCPG